MILESHHGGGLSQKGFTLVEGIVGMAVVFIVTFSVYGGITFGVLSAQIARENLRASQVMIEKVEMLRLCNWDQLTTPGYLPTNFSARYYDTSTTSGMGVTYTGTFSITPTGLPVNYSNDLRTVTITVNWETKGIQHTRQLSTRVARYGIQPYVYD